MESTKKATQPRVLVIEDNPDHGWMLQKTLSSSLGAAVTVVRTAREGREQLADDTFDAVVLDNRLPDAEGSRIVADIRAAGYDGILLLVTAQGTEEIVSHALDAGATDYVIKNRGYAERVAEEITARLAAAIGDDQA